MLVSCGCVLTAEICAAGSLGERVLIVKYGMSAGQFLGRDLSLLVLGMALLLRPKTTQMSNRLC